MIVFTCVPHFGTPFAHLAWALWIIDAALSVIICFSLPFIIMRDHSTNNSLSTMTAAWLLPIVSTIVASASGGIVASALPNPQHALWTIITSYILLGTGFPLAMVVLTMYFHRLTIYRLPPREVVVSVFLPLGPLGQGSFALMELGKVSLKIFPLTNTLDASAGRTFYNIGHLFALIIWGYGLVWLFFALATLWHARPFPFNMGWWGFTFPLGVYAVATTTLAEDLPSAFFRVLGTMFSLVVVVLWAGVGVETARKAVEGTIFFAPCVGRWEEEREKARREAKGLGVAGRDGAGKV
jgi:tellurite resistance protein TehA-like permease